MRGRFRSVSVIGFIGAAWLAASTAALAQTPPAGAPPQGRGGQNQQPPKNLQVLPKDMPRPQVVQLMQGFTAALGVRCEYCHIDEGRGGRQDYAADDKAPKATARVMLHMTMDVNAKLKSDLTSAKGVQVQCVTCHRGVAVPMQLADVLTKTAGEKGGPAAMDQYRELRKQYYGGMAYDFSEGGLIPIAQRLGQSDPEAALKWLELNLEFYPKSVRTYVGMAQIQNRKGDKDAAIKSLEKAVEVDPNNNQAKQMLAQLKGGQ